MQVPDAVYHLMRHTELRGCNLSSNAITKLPPKFAAKFSLITARGALRSATLSAKLNILFFGSGFSIRQTPSEINTECLALTAQLFARFGTGIERVQRTRGLRRKKEEGLEQPKKSPLRHIRCPFSMDSAFRCSRAGN
ncbi:hypothetical protein J437_LFUL007519 [Ladona fulva]|uniref:Uncharacterized protein n=1 Tax=Ladona fulva TaxID=123851 RepID=A0A8K0K8R6_LADFU|nr:hypothetical protein J437_LFUL007519 [Ladona fulva]